MNKTEERLADQSRRTPSGVTLVRALEAGAPAFLAMYAFSAGLQSSAQIEAATLSLYSSLSNKLTNIRLCHGVDSQAMIVSFQAAIDAIYFSPVDTES